MNQTLLKLSVIVKHDYHDFFVVLLIKQILQIFFKTQANNINWVVPFSKTFER